MAADAALQAADELRHKEGGSWGLRCTGGSGGCTGGSGGAALRSWQSRAALCYKGGS